MPKYRGTEVEIRMATTIGALATASAIPNIQAVAWKVDQGITQQPSGYGSRATVGKEGIQKINGTVTSDYDETAVDGQNILLQEENALETAALTRHVMEVKVVPTGTKYQFTNVIGTYDYNGPSVDGIQQSKFAWVADTVAKTT